MEGFENLNFDIKGMINEKYGISLTEKEINYIYNMAVKKCQIADHENALNLFQFLMIYETGNPLYIKAAAGCLQSLERYQEARQLYQIVYMTDINKHSDCLFYSGYCSIKLKDYANASLFLEDFLSKNKNQELDKKARLLLEITKQSESKVDAQ